MNYLCFSKMQWYGGMLCIIFYYPKALLKVYFTWRIEQNS
jgi:hypothetical protein